ncbi:hypothetical protein ACTJKN_05315 [Pedobacter sp. 22163]|uniref:hypothetical protein n=1 Tax=Pedobacter sp. 22163 TaxID=3453883 RepID=UPI003F850240
MKSKTKNPYHFDADRQKIDPLMRIAFISIALIVIIAGAISILRQINNETKRKFPTVYENRLG